MGIIENLMLKLFSIKNPVYLIDGLESTDSKAGDYTASDDVAVGDDLTVTGLATIGETLAVTGATTLSSTLSVGGKISLYAIGSAAASASGLLFGIGTSANPALSAVAGSIMMEVRSKNSATSGDSRCLYMRHEISGAGGGGESLRSFSKVTAAASTVRGAHISIDLSTTGSCSGFGAGVDAQVLYGNTSYSSCLTALNCELYAAGASTAITGVNSFIRCVFGGNATGLAAIEDSANLFSLIGGSIASGNMVVAETDETKFSHKIRINAYGTTLYLMCTAT